MLTIEVNLPIGNEAENRWMAMYGEDAVVFSLDTIKRAMNEHPEENDIRLNFNCDGGYVSEGFAIYDYLRTSGKNIYCNIESGCHSMAIVLLLAAPLENRTAQKHAKSLIHCVHTEVYGNATAEELERAAEEIKEDEEKILQIYAERTGEDIETLRTLMREEKMRDTDFLLEHHFISSTNQYNTNFLSAGRNNKITNQKNAKTMAKTIKEALQMASDCLGKITNMLGTSEPSNYDHTDADGNVLFSTDAKDETLEVGMTASPDGTFELPDGRTIVIADGVIAEIREAETEQEDEEVVNLRNQVEELSAQVTNLTEQLTEAANVITELQSQLSSNYKPKSNKRITPAKKPSERTEAENHAEHMEEQRVRLGLKKKED